MCYHKIFYCYIAITQTFQNIFYTQSVFHSVNYSSYFFVLINRYNFFYLGITKMLTRISNGLSELIFNFSDDLKVLIFCSFNLLNYLWDTHYYFNFTEKKEKVRKLIDYLSKAVTWWSQLPWHHECHLSTFLLSSTFSDIMLLARNWPQQDYIQQDYIHRTVQTFLFLNI